MSDALSIGANLRNFNFSLYPERKGFDNKGFSRSLGLMPYLPMPQLEDFWEDCTDEFEIFKRGNMRLVLEQVVSLQIQLDAKGLEEDYLELFEPGYFACAEAEMPPINWDEEENDDIQLRTKGVLERTAAWVANKKAMKSGVKSNSARSNKDPLPSPKRLSNNASMPVRAGKDNKSPQLRHRSNSTLDFCTPRHTRSRSVAQRRMDHAKDVEVKDTILDTQIFEVEDLDSDVANALDSHTVTVAMTPPSKAIEGTTSSSATPKWLTTSVNKNWNFLPVTIPI